MNRRDLLRLLGLGLPAAFAVRALPVHELPPLKFDSAPRQAPPGRIDFLSMKHWGILDAEALGQKGFNVILLDK